MFIYRDTFELWQFELRLDLDLEVELQRALVRHLDFFDIDVRLGKYVAYCRSWFFNRRTIGRPAMIPSRAEEPARGSYNARPATDRRRYSERGTAGGEIHAT